MAIYTLLSKRHKLLNALQGLLTLYKRSWDLLFNNRNARTALPSPHFYTTSPIDSFCLSQPTRHNLKLLPCPRGAATKWLRGGSTARDQPLRASKEPLSWLFLNQEVTPINRPCLLATHAAQPTPALRVTFCCKARLPHFRCAL